MPPLELRALTRAEDGGGGFAGDGLVSDGFDQGS